jgi:hypothetical protein
LASFRNHVAAGAARRQNWLRSAKTAEDVFLMDERWNTAAAAEVALPGPLLVA